MVLLTVTGACSSGGGGGYKVGFAFPEATGLIKGSRVQLRGFDAGKVLSLEVRDGKALVWASVDERHAPLRAGTTARIGYRGLIGDRTVDVVPGPSEAAALPKGAIVTGNTERIELEQLFQALDPETRAAITRLVPNLDSALAGREDELNATLDQAGPAVQAVSAVLGAVGQDGLALRRLLTSVKELATRLNSQRSGVRATLTGLDSSLSAAATKSEQLQQAVHALPGVLSQASSALDQVPGAAATALPLLNDLRPVVKSLPAVAAELRPLVSDLGPTLSELRPTLEALGNTLVETPALLDRAHATIPPLSSALGSLVPVLDFLRPYTPDLAGVVANLGSAAAPFDANGHYVRLMVAAGSTSWGRSPDKLSPLLRRRYDRGPGEAQVGFTDATGSPVR